MAYNGDRFHRYLPWPGEGNSVSTNSLPHLSRHCQDIQFCGCWHPTSLIAKRGHHVARYLSYVLALLLFASFSVAQSSDHVALFGGYSYMNPEFTSTASGGVSGWNVSATFKLVRYVGIVADFSGFRPSGGGASASYQTIMGGPQVSVRLGRIEPFAHFLIGLTHGTLTQQDEGGSKFNQIGRASGR